MLILVLVNAAFTELPSGCALKSSQLSLRLEFQSIKLSFGDFGPPECNADIKMISSWNSMGRTLNTLTPNYEPAC